LFEAAEKVLTRSVHDPLKQLIDEIAQANGWQVVELEIQPNLCISSSRRTPVQ
jgi:REP element-mobilizing transposase RayT